jgi:hypothetical protein
LHVTLERRDVIFTSIHHRSHTLFALPGTGDPPNEVVLLLPVAGSESRRGLLDNDQITIAPSKCEACEAFTPADLACPEVL